MRIWEKKEDGGWDTSGTALCECLWDLCELRGEVEHVYTTYAVDAYNKRAQVTYISTSQQRLTRRTCISPHVLMVLA